MPLISSLRFINTVSDLLFCEDFVEIKLAFLQQPITVPIVSNISIIEKETIIIIAVKNDPSGNINPSLNCDDDIDLKVKSKLITDICNIIGLIPYTHDKREKPLDKYNYYINGIEEAVTESLCEFVRPTGGFERIFPLVDNIEHYKKFIDKPGEQNLSLWDNMMKYKHKE